MSLVRIVALGALSLMISTPLHAEPERRLHDTPTRRFDIQHRELRVRFDFETRAVHGRMTLAGVALDSLSTLELDARELTIVSVRDSARGPLGFSGGDHGLVVRFPRPLTRDERATVTIEYDATPRAGLYWVLPDADHPGRRREVWSQGETQGSRWWFPDFDQPVERATTDLYYTVPAAMFALGNGRLVGATEDRARHEKTYHWSVDFPMPSYLVTAAVGTFAKLDTTVRGIPVEYYVPPDKADRVARSLGRTPEMMTFFTDLLQRPYPYAKYAQVVVQDYSFGGMENLSATTMVERILMDPIAAQARTQEGLVAHELAHQWFGDYITCREWAHTWLNEGFATYFADLWHEHARGRDDLDRSLLDERTVYFENDARTRHPVVETNWRLTSDPFDRHGYNKGAWVLHMLRRRLGDEAFFRGIRRHLEVNGGKSVDTDAFRLAMEDATGAGLDGFFTQWLNRAGFPELKVSWNWVESRSLAHVVVEQTQPSDSLTPLFRFDLPVRFALANGESRMRIAVDGRRHELWLPLAEKPRYVEVNDDLSILCRVTFDRPVVELAAQLKDAPLGASRSEAARALGEKLGQRGALEALALAVKQDPLYSVRQAAADAIGKRPAVDALAALAPGLADADPRVRLRAAAALGAMYGVPGAAEAARGTTRDRITGVAAEGYTALARLEGPGALDALLEGLRRPAWNDEIEVAALGGLGTLGDPRGLAPLARATHWREPIAVRVAACEALGKLGRFLPFEPVAGRPSRRDARRVLEPLLLDDRLQVRRAAANGLGDLGDPAALEPLARLIERDPEDRNVQAAIEARAKIRAASEAGPAAMRGELEKLKERNRALELRIEGVEQELKK